MDFALEEHQRIIVQVTGDVLDSTLGEAGADPDRAWKGLAQAGMLSLALPPRLGGEGYGILEISLLLAEAGRRAAPVPALSTLVLGMLPVVRWARPELQDELLPEVAAGNRHLTAALAEPGQPMPAQPRTMLSGDGKVTGTKIGVRDAERSYRMLVSAYGPGGPALVLLDPRAAGVVCEPTPSATGMSESTVHFAQTPAQVIGAAAAVTDLYHLATAAACALGDGVLSGALALTREHIATREQFGRPLATFQSVSAQIADVYIASRTLHLAARSACWRLATGRTARADLDVAAYWLAQHAPPAVRTCHHLHGGIGVDETYPLHRYSSWIKDLVRFTGGADYRLEKLDPPAAEQPWRGR